MPDDVMEPDIGTPGKKAVLAFWAKNMCLIRDARMSWPGFSYTDPEWARFYTLSSGIGMGDRQKFNLINAVVFITIAAIVIFGGFLPVASALFPDPANTRASLFLVLLALFALLILGFGLPLSMRIAAWFSASDELLAQIVTTPQDAALMAKIRRQIWRMIVIMCGLLVPGALLFITFNINAGPAITVLKWASIALMALSTWSLRRTRVT